jgi:hypothetical protein
MFLVEAVGSVGNSQSCPSESTALFLEVASRV